MEDLIYRFHTTTREFSLNDEHEMTEWIVPSTAADRLHDCFNNQLARAVRLAQE